MNQKDSNFEHHRLATTSSRRDFAGGFVSIHPFKDNYDITWSQLVEQSAHGMTYVFSSTMERKPIARLGPMKSRLTKH